MRDYGAASVRVDWPGKHPPVPVSPLALHLVETFLPAPRRSPDPQHAIPENALYHGDNRGILAHLLQNGLPGKVKVIYADPPYNSGVRWTRRVRLRGPKPRGASMLMGRQAQYDDIWDAATYLQFIYDRLFQLRDLLADDGSLWLHCDHRHAHHLRCLLDEVFGPENYLNTITWRSQTARGAKVNAFYFPNSAHTLLVFARNRAAPTCWHQPKKRFVLTEREAAAAFMRDERGFFRTSDPGTYSFASLKQLKAQGRLYAPYGGEVIVDEAAQRVYASNGGNIGVKYYLETLDDGRYAVERAVDNIWDDVPGLGTTPGEDLGYPTQKTEALLARIIETASDPGDLILDPFAGSGTALAVAQKLGRRWIGCDTANGAIQTAKRRLQAVIGEQAAAGAAQDGFAVYYAAGAATEAARPAPQVELSITPIQVEPARIRVTIHRVTAPALDGKARHLRPDEWPAVVESIAIDPAFDGRVLRAVLADAPQRRAATVTGCYELYAPVLPTTVAVRVADVAGGETTIVRRVQVE